MKKYLCFILAFQVLATCSSTGQGMQTLVKLGAFFQHFAHHVIHQQENTGIVSFMQLHYSDHEHHEESHGEHKNLPFQHHHHDQQMQMLQSPFLLPQPVQIVAVRVADNFSNPLITNRQQWHSSSFLDDIWQPPKA